MIATVESLNIGIPKKEVFHGKEVMTGICKTPVSLHLHLTKTGFEGDGVADLKHHGGADKAVCVYSINHNPYWEDALGIKLPPAPFGENLSVSELLEDAVCIGDIFLAGTALVQVSQPRQPCKTVALRYGRDDMVKLIVNSGRTGFYLRVLEEGVVWKGAQLILKARDSSNITVSFANHIYHHQKSNCEAIKEILAAQALSGSWRQSFQKMLEGCKR
ncbi:MAG: MOSC domain-containing protein [Nitrospirae bacterium]|nr:MOSC domain-containing protein [Nitrospirota bacterium]